MTISLNPTESYIDSSLTCQSFSSINLSLQISLNDVSFCITDNSQGNYLAIVSYVFIGKVTILEIEDFILHLFEKQALFKKDFSQVTISFKSNSATLVPSALYDANYLATYINITNTKMKAQCIASDFIKEINAFNIYHFPQSIENIIRNKFINAKFIHSSTSFIQSVLSNYLISEISDNVFVNINNNELEIVIIKNGKLHLYNIFQFNMKEDFLYYLLFAMKQYKCNPSGTNLFLMGKIFEQSPIHQLLIKYIANVSFVKKVSETNLDVLLNEVPEHYYFTLINMNKCV